MAYDDLMGLDMYDDGMGGWYSTDMLRDQVIAAGASAGSIMLASWALPKLAASKMFSDSITDEKTRHRVTALLGIVGGMVGGRLLWDTNRDAAMAVVGGVAGLGLAQLVDSFFDANLLGGGAAAMYPLGAADDALLAAYGSDNASALASLESANVVASRGAFGGFAGTVVNPEQLMGLDAAVVAGETLGDNGYASYLF